MPKVSINIIKDWFKNQSKPPQEQFWAWLDSFWHKDEPIPQSAVENLVPTLQKKADLVNGVVPEEQLPFSVVTSEVIALGPREITGNVLKLKVHSSGTNVVRVKGKLITRSYENTWTFSEITGSGINVLRGYAVKGEDDFFMVESGEQAEVSDPEIPVDALEIFRLALSAAGIVQDPDAENGYKLRDEDPWRTVQILNAAPMNIVTATSPSTSFNIEVFTLAPKIAAIKTKVKKNTRDGLEITLYNNSDTPVSLMAGDYVEDLTYSSFPFADNYTLKPRSFAKFKRKENKYHELAGGGSASFPEGAAPGDVLTEGTGGPEWSNRLTNAENEIDAEVVNRALADNALQSQITTEKNRNDTQDGQIADLYIAQAKFTVTSSITNETLSTVSNLKQNNRNNLIANGVNAINITLTATAEAKFQAIYHKLGSGTITFVAGSGVSLVLIDGTAKMEGTAELQTAAVHRDGNKYYVQISNR